MSPSPPGAGRHHIEVLGGNQGDQVSNARFPRKQILGIRWPAELALPAIGATALPVGASAPVSDR
ncbi:hypothetical protein [Sphingomonas sp. MMS24-J13]|uniref:hypothetical protein n=1 Tax=Sphingomonas sp. MMS24-J13 TaxID=3238686 RepID=UPI0038516A84